jgi:glutathione peroxidase
MKRLAALLAALTVSALAVPAPAAAATPAGAAAPATTSCPALLQYTFPRLQDEKPQPLCQYAGKVLLVVNTASYCGYTPQYQGLEDLYSRYRDRGLVVLGFPSNDFNQEKSSNKEIADFCENTFGVKFPMFGKTSVAGPEANALFRQLAAQTGKAPAWNFHKYLIGRDGKVVAHFASRTTPSDAELLKLLEQQLAAK